MQAPQQIIVRVVNKNMILSDASVSTLEMRTFLKTQIAGLKFKPFADVKLAEVKNAPDQTKDGFYTNMFVNLQNVDEDEIDLLAKNVFDHKDALTWLNFVIDNSPPAKADYLIAKLNGENPTGPWLKEKQSLITHWLDNNKQEVLNFYEEMRYKAFSQEKVNFLLFKRFSPAAIVKLAMTVALRGTNEAKIGNVIIEGKETIATYIKAGLISPSGTKKEDALTLQRIAAITPHVVAKTLYTISQHHELPARFDNCIVPVWLQFPTAISLPFNNLMKSEIKLMALRFSFALKSKNENAKINVQLTEQISANPIPLPIGAEWDFMRNHWAFAAQGLIPPEHQQIHASNIATYNFLKVASTGNNPFDLIVTGQNEEAKKAMKALVEPKKKD